MQHLMPETLARLVDEAPTEDEARHVTECDECRVQLEAMRADYAALRSLPMIEPPPTEWPDLELRLLDEGLVRRRNGIAAWPAWTRAAAAILLFAVGAASGAYAFGGRAPAGDSPAFAETGERTALPVLNGEQGPLLVSAAVPRNADEALALYRQAEAVYLDALTRVAQIGGQGDSGDPLARLAALESIAAITRSALDESPADPVINGYHLTALAQREATLRQIAATKSDRWF